MAQASAAAYCSKRSASLRSLTAAIPHHAPTTEIDTYRKQGHQLGACAPCGDRPGHTVHGLFVMGCTGEGVSRALHPSRESLCPKPTSSLLKALKLAEGLVEEVPDHHLAIVQRRMLRQACERIQLPRRLVERKTLLAQFPADSTSVTTAQRRLYAAHTEKFADAMAALELEANGKKLNLALFKASEAWSCTDKVATMMRKSMQKRRRRRR